MKFCQNLCCITENSSDVDSELQQIKDKLQLENNSRFNNNSNMSNDTNFWNSHEKLNDNLNKFNWSYEPTNENRKTRYRDDNDVVIIEKSVLKKPITKLRKSVSFDILNDDDNDYYNENRKSDVEYAKICGTLTSPKFEAFETLKNILEQNVPKTKINVNQNELNLNLSELKSSSSLSSSCTSLNEGKKSKTTIPNELLKYSGKNVSSMKILNPRYKSHWEFKNENNNKKTKKFGEGKVKELAEHFEQMKLEIENPQRRYQVNNRKISDYLKNDFKYQSTPELCNYRKRNENKLTKFEEEKVLQQLKEWSEYGTKGKELNSGGLRSYNSDIHINKNERYKNDEFNNVMGPNELHYLSSYWKSETNLNECFKKLNIEYKIPKSYENLSSICIETVIMSNNDREPTKYYQSEKNINNNFIPVHMNGIKSSSPNYLYKSCPELYQKYSIYKMNNHSPPHSSKFMTLRKLKRNNQKQKFSTSGFTEFSEMDLEDVESK